MANKEDEYKKLRAYLNKSIRGANTDAILKALSTGPVHLINNVEAVNDSLYIVSAKEKFLDQRLGDKGVVRPPEVGLSDEVFREIGIEITTRKQVRDLVHQLLRILYGEIFTRATSPSFEVENYTLENGDNLILLFDDSEPVEIVFTSGQFQNINSATAQEVADAITKSIRKAGKTGAAFSREENGANKVVLISSTDGPSSSVRVLGGKAQNTLKFDQIRSTSADSTTQWSLSQQAGGTIKAVWTGGADPALGRVKVGDYVNIYGSAFFKPNTCSLPVYTSQSTCTLGGGTWISGFDNRGTFTITAVQGGSIGEAYIEYENPNGVAQDTGSCSLDEYRNQSTCTLGGGTWTSSGQGTVDAILFFNAKKRILTTNERYAAAFQTSPRTIEIFMPATTKIVRRDRKGAAHIYGHISEKTIINLPSGAELQSNNSFSLNDFFNLVKYRVVYNVDNSGIVKNFSEKIIEINVKSTDSAITVANKTAIKISSIYAFTCKDNENGSINITNTNQGNVSDIQSINMPSPFSVNIIEEGKNINSSPGQPGPYLYDITVGYTLSDKAALTTESLSVNSDAILFVDDASQFPDNTGYLIVGTGTSHQEGPVPYISRPSSQTIRVNPSYKFKNEHPIGTDIALVSKLAPPSPNKDGTDLPFFLTDSVAGRIYAEKLIKEITATGIVVIVYILYPNDVGLGNYYKDSSLSEKYYIWGTEEDL